MHHNSSQVCSEIEKCYWNCGKILVNLPPFMDLSFVKLICSKYSKMLHIICFHELLRTYCTWIFFVKLFCHLKQIFRENNFTVKRFGNQLFSRKFLIRSSNKNTIASKITWNQWMYFQLTLWPVFTNFLYKIVKIINYFLFSTTKGT